MILRKNTEKSNTIIGIFSDKSPHYNLAILETLFSYEHVTAWRIAEILQKKINPTTKKEIKEAKRYHTQKIYSVIQRKDGRLNDLKNKGYVTMHNKLWTYTMKGLIALYVQKSDLVTKTLEQEKKEAHTQASAWLDRILSLSPELTPIEEEIDKEEIAEPFRIVTRNSSENRFIFFTKFLKEAEFLISKGIINLDRISEDDLMVLITNKSAIESILEKRNYKGE